MAELKVLLELRTKIKDKKPDFIRQDYHRRKRLGRKVKWRKPKGIHSKIRHHFKGRRKMPSPGYRSPSKVNAFHSAGLVVVRVLSAGDLKKINKETEGIIVAKTIGMKNRLEILRKAKEMGVQVLNLNIDDTIKKIEDFIDSKIKKKPTDIKKEEIKKDAKKVEQSKTEELTDEQKKQAEKKEKDKLLTKKV